MKRITIGKVEYIIEFSLEATMYNECTEKIMDMLANTGIAEAKLKDESVEEHERAQHAVKDVIASMADIPQRALILFYAGLLEHHGADGDRSVLSKSVAKKLLVDYLKENEGMTLYDVMSDMMQEIVNDHFFDLIGVEKAVKLAEQNARKVKTPQDHKRKSGNS